MVPGAPFQPTPPPPDHAPQPPLAEGEREVTAETAGWTWLEGFVDVGLGHFNDRDYSADEMVDAFMAGQEDVKVALAQMTRERDAAVKENKRVVQAQAEAESDLRVALQERDAARLERDAAVAQGARLLGAIEALRLKEPRPLPGWVSWHDLDAALASTSEPEVGA